MKTSSLILALLLFATALHAAPGPAALIAQGDVLDAKEKTQEALKAYLEAEKAGADGADFHIKIAKEYGESMTDCKSSADQIKAGQNALAYAKRALKEAPDLSDANLAIAICYGRLLNLMPAKTEVEYSRYVHEYAQKAVKLDSRSDYAWHMLGRWNQAVATMGGFTRGLVAVVYGSLPDASLEKSKECFEKALKLKPGRLVHHIELGRTLAFMGRKAEAKKEIEEGLAMSNKERDDPQSKQRGRETLKTL